MSGTEAIWVAIGCFGGTAILAISIQFLHHAVGKATLTREIARKGGTVIDVKVKFFGTMVRGYTVVYEDRDNDMHRGTCIYHWGRIYWKSDRKTFLDQDPDQIDRP
ncbi:hypothetical protein ACFL4W_02145 [Planctomycetota bacterium]